MLDAIDPAVLRYWYRWFLVEESKCWMDCYALWLTDNRPDLRDQPFRIRTDMDQLLQPFVVERR
jgi:hypothetical protein